MSLRLTGFYNYIEDYIESYPSSYSPPYNVDLARLYGVECYGDWTVNELLELDGNFTYEGTKKSGDPLMPESREVINIPKYFFNLGLTLSPLNDFDIRTNFRYTYHRKTGGAPQREVEESGGYATFDLQAKYRFNKSMEFSFVIENLLDKDNAWETQDYPLPGRTIWGGIKYNF